MVFFILLLFLAASMCILWQISVFIIPTGCIWVTYCCR